MIDVRKHSKARRTQTHTAAWTPRLWALTTQTAEAAGLSRSRLIRTAVTALLHTGVVLQTPEGPRTIDGAPVDLSEYAPAVILDYSEAEADALAAELESEV